MSKIISAILLLLTINCNNITQENKTKSINPIFLAINDEYKEKVKEYLKAIGNNYTNDKIYKGVTLLHFSIENINVIKYLFRKRYS